MEVYDEVEIEDMDFDAETGVFTYPCPCGDRFVFTMEELSKGEAIGKCPSCSLTIRVIFSEKSFNDYADLMKEMAA